jgi:GH15 family glucan-1,4-alpha-glucosidase
MTAPLEHLGMIGDGETAALVSRQGSIDWLCLPRFDSPACCSALLGNRDHGHWTIAPEHPVLRAEQRYQPDTVILETDLTSKEGTIRLTDFMPIRSQNPIVIRIVTGLSGSVPTRLTAAFRFDYGNMPPWVTRKGDAVVMLVGPDKTVLHGSDPFEITGSTVTSSFIVAEGSYRAFILTYCAPNDADDEQVSPSDALASTQTYWREWIGRFDRAVEHPDVVRRSLLTLKALIHRPTGGLVAAPTSSLPEQPGGKMNWDYRYC